MPHIIILDEFGNEIGREEHTGGGGGLAALALDDDHEPTIIVVNLERVGELLKGKKKEKEKD